MELKRLTPIRGAGSANVDFDSDIIRDVVIVQEGEAKGHEVWLDARFVNDIAKQGKALGSVKSRFGHPNMCGSSLGDYIGTFQNFSTRTNEGVRQAIADLHLDRVVADKSPKYDKSITDYILNFANSQPDMFGNSIVFSGTGEERKVREGDKKITKTFMILSEGGFSASDIVDDPAATSGMFSEFNIASAVTDFMQLNNVDLGQFDELLQNDSFTKFAEMLLSNPKIAHRILNIVLNNESVYQEFKEKINNKPIDIAKLIELF
jgi:hypothetical protein